jgi:uncharacterized membrane protein YhiD involved in acid resistance
VTPDFWWPGTEVALPIAVRLVAALILGAVVAWIYRKARNEPASSFTATLVLLAVLIAMVTQVIGDNIPRAFSLVGALSIVRFRTVVRDTQDTAYVIFAVAVGMAVGSSSLWVALAGIVIVGIAAAVMRSKSVGEMLLAHRLAVRVAIGQDTERVIGPTLDAFLAARQLVGAATARQGAAIQVTYRAVLKAPHTAAELVTALNRLEGVQGVDMERLEGGQEERKANDA